MTVNHLPKILHLYEQLIPLYLISAHNLLYPGEFPVVENLQCSDTKDSIHEC